MARGSDLDSVGSPAEFLSPASSIAVDASPQEWAALDALWDRVHEEQAGADDPLTNDSSLLRFLRARELDTEKSFQMWFKWKNWRAEFGVDNLTVSASHLVRVRKLAGRRRM